MWKCPKCGEMLDEQFEACWQCAAACDGPRVDNDEKHNRPSAEPRGQCLGCGYALKGLTEYRCPECGRTFDPDDLTTFRTPVSGTGHVHEVFRHHSGRVQAVKRGFCWPALFFGMAWAFTKELWLVGLGLIVVNRLLSVVETSSSGLPGSTMILVLNLIVVVVVGGYANSWRVAALHRRKYKLIGQVNAPNPRDAVHAITGKPWRQPFVIRRVGAAILIVLGLSFLEMYASGEFATPASRTAVGGPTIQRRPNARSRPPLREQQGSARVERPRSRAEMERSRQLSELRRYTRAIGANPDAAELYHRRAHVHEKLEQWEEAADDFTAAIARRPADLHLHQTRAAVCLRLERYEDAAADYEECRKLLESGPHPSSAYNNLAWTYVAGPAAVRDGEKALPLAERAVELQPDDGNFINTLGVAYYRVGRFQEARDTLLRSDELNGGIVADVAFLVLSHMQLGDNRQAYVAAGRLRDLMTDTDDAESLDFSREAIDAFAEALARDPENAWTLATVGTLLWTLDQHERALARYDQAIAIEPQLAEIQRDRTMLLGELGRPAEAVPGARAEN